MISRDAWLAIASYREFYDLPRLILVVDGEVGFWILDSQFDDEKDDYSGNYKVYYAGIEPKQAQAAFERHAEGVAGPLVEMVPTTRFEFDPTRRRELMLRSR